MCQLTMCQTIYIIRQNWTLHKTLLQVIHCSLSLACSLVPSLCACAATISVQAIARRPRPTQAHYMWRTSKSLLRQAVAQLLYTVLRGGHVLSTYVRVGSQSGRSRAYPRRRRRICQQRHVWSISHHSCSATSFLIIHNGICANPHTFNRTGVGQQNELNHAYPMIIIPP